MVYFLPAAIDGVDVEITFLVLADAERHWKAGQTAHRASQLKMDVRHHPNNRVNT
jgi:hypothetical protein